VTRRLRRRPDDPEQLREHEAAAGAPAPESVLDLQRSAGNAAVARVLAREPAPITSLQFTKPAPVIGGPNPFLTYRPQLAPDVERAVDRWLGQQAPGIKLAMLEGATSMPEVVDRVRRGVPEAAEASPEAIRPRVIDIVGVVPETRGKPDLGGQNVEWAARISNMFPIPPTSVTFGGSQTSFTIGIKGAELKTGKITTKATPGGAETELKQGDVKVGASGKWDGSEFGLKTEVGGVKFESKVHRKGEGWGWSGGLVIPLGGDEADELPDISGAVSGAHSAIGESLGHLQGGGSLSDGFVTERMGRVKPAIDAVGKIAGRKGKSGASLRISGSADGGGWTAGVALVIVF
jgi:hypothetical protein